MPKVRFLPMEITVDVPEGTLINDAARQAEILVDLPCGGKGTCGKCLVKITGAAVKSRPSTMPADEEAADGYVLACRSAVIGDIDVFVPEMVSDYIRISDDGIDIGDVNAKELETLSPQTRQICINVPAPGKEDGLSDSDRLDRAVRSALEAVAKGQNQRLPRPGIATPALAGSQGARNDKRLRKRHCEEALFFADEAIPSFVTNATAALVGKSIKYPLHVIRKMADVLRENNGAVTLTVSDDDSGVRAIDIKSGHSGHKNLGVAVDLGTTTISVQLIDLMTGKSLSARNGYNDQIRCGLDVISRINYACNAFRIEDLRQLAVRSVNRLIREALDDSGNSIESVSACRISGNTVMTHLVLGLKPEYIRLAPYTPTLLNPGAFRASELGVDILPEAIVSFSPCVGGYVGGDITAGILATKLIKESEDVCMFIDIGTNGEIVIGNKDFLMTCACSAGPAFEGAGIDCGMRATAGAIDHVTIDNKTGLAFYTTIGGGKPLGICGSGLIDLISGLFVTGWIDPSGRFNRSEPCPAISIDGRRAYYTVVDAKDTGSGRPVTISETDVDNLMRAKAAIYSAASLMLEQIGAAFKDISTFYVAGGFGRFLDIDHAICLGLLPDIPSGRFKYMGNASLLGSALCLLSKDYSNLQEELSKRMTYIDLSASPGYMDHYTSALFLPHTDFRQFPNVMKQISRLDR